MFLNLADFQLTPAAFPDLTEKNPKSKNKAYCLQYGRAFISAYRQGQSRDFYNGRVSGRYTLAEKYATGEQQVKTILKDENGQPDADSRKADLRKPLKLLKKSLRAVDGKLKDHDFVATVTPIDATAQDEKRAYEARMRVQMEHGAFLQSLGMELPGAAAAPGQPGQPAAASPDVPVDEDELALHMEVKYRHRDAMLLELKLALALYASDYNQINRACLRDETTYGSSAIYLALRGPRRLPVRLHPGNCFFLPSDTEDYANLQAGAHVEKVSLAQVLQEIEDDPDTRLSASEREDLISLAKSKMPGSGSYYYDETLGGQPEMAGQLEVIRFSFKSADAVVMKEYTNKFGNAQVREKPAGYKNQGGTPGKVHRQTVQNWYEGSLIVGSDIGYGCRRAYEQLRDEENPFDCHPLYVVTSPDMLGGFTESVVEQCMTLCDEASAAWSRARFKLATMRGSWLEFDLDAIEGALEKDGTATKTIASFMRDGIIVGRKQQARDNGVESGNIVTAGELPFEREINMQFAVIERCAQQIEAITGINGTISAADPASRQGVGVTQMAVQGAENTLEYLYFAKQRRFERVVRAIAVSVKQSEARAPLTGPVPPGTPGAGVDVVGTSDTLATRVIQCKIERKPNQQEWARLYDQVAIMLTQQIIEPEDAIFIQQVDNLKQAGALLAIRAKRKRMQAAEQAQQQTSMASQQQQESAKVTGEEARATLTAEYELRMQLEQLKGENALAAIREQNKGQLAAAEMQHGAKWENQQDAHAHAADQQDADRALKLTQSDAQLESKEYEAAQQRDADAALAAQAPRPAA